MQLQSYLRRQCHRIAVHLDQFDYPGDGECEIVPDLGWEVCISVRRLSPPVVIQNPVVAAPSPHLQPTAAQQRILEGCTREPQTAKRIAANLGRKPNDAFRRHLHTMVDVGLLIRKSGGFCLPPSA